MLSHRGRTGLDLTILSAPFSGIRFVIDWPVSAPCRRIEATTGTALVGSRLRLRDSGHRALDGFARLLHGRSRRCRLKRDAGVAGPRRDGGVRRVP